MPTSEKKVKSIITKITLDYISPEDGKMKARNIPIDKTRRGVRGWRWKGGGGDDSHNDKRGQHNP